MAIHFIDSASFEDAIRRFPVGQSASGTDRHGTPIKGRITEVKQGNRIAIVMTEPAGSGME